MSHSHASRLGVQLFAMLRLRRSLCPKLSTPCRPVAWHRMNSSIVTESQVIRPSWPCLRKAALRPVAAKSSIVIGRQVFGCALFGLRLLAVVIIAPLPRLDIVESLC